ncbi:MAG: IclR family transcriptional regulator [Actinomycetota bacterium]|nr:IclR family transcriptional regulator [Actinomycetota bacterium]
MIQSIDRAIRILNLLQGSRRMSLSEIAGQLELPPSTVHGILKTLVVHGMVGQEAAAGRYRLGPTVLRLGSVFLETLELRARALAWSEDLAQRTGFAVRAGVLSLGDVVIIHHEPRPDGTRQVPEVGIVIPAHVSALGKAVLAYDRAAADEMLSRPDALFAMTGETVTDRRTFRRRLRETQRSGLATEVEEAVLGECSAAAPIFQSCGEIVGAMGIVVPASEWPVPPAALDALRAAARAVSRELGAATWPAASGPGLGPARRTPVVIIRRPLG